MMVSGAALFDDSFRCFLLFGAAAQDWAPARGHPRTIASEERAETTWRLHFLARLGLSHLEALGLEACR